MDRNGPLHPPRCFVCCAAGLLAALLAGPVWAQPTSRPAPLEVTRGSTAFQNHPMLIDVNGATAEQLKTLPNISAALAAAIIRGRPYQTEDELIGRAILPRAVYDGIRRRVLARQPN
jgi:competence protein ComEA